MPVNQLIGSFARSQLRFGCLFNIDGTKLLIWNANSISCYGNISVVSCFRGNGKEEMEKQLRQANVCFVARFRYLSPVVVVVVVAAAASVSQPMRVKRLKSKPLKIQDAIWRLCGENNKWKGWSRSLFAGLFSPFPYSNVVDFRPVQLPTRELETGKLQEDIWLRAVFSRGDVWWAIETNWLTIWRLLPLSGSVWFV